MRAASGCDEEDGVQARTVADDVRSLGGGGEIFVGCGIGGDCRGDLLGEGAARKGG